MRFLLTTIRILFLVGFLATANCMAQRLHVINPDGSMFQSIAIGQHVAIMLPARFGASARYAGQLTNIRPDSVTMTIRRRSQAVAVTEIQGLRRISKFGASVRRSSQFIVAGAISVSGDVVGGLTKEQAGGTRLLFTAGSSIGAGVLALALIRLPPLKKAKNGYSFRVGN